MSCGSSERRIAATNHFTKRYLLIHVIRRSTISTAVLVSNENGIVGVGDGAYWSAFVDVGGECILFRVAIEGQACHVLGFAPNFQATCLTVPHSESKCEQVHV